PAPTLGPRARSAGIPSSARPSPQSARPSGPRSEQNPWRCRIGWPRRLPPPGVSRRCASLEEAFAGGLMRQRLASVSLRNSALHLRQEVETLDGVLDGGVWRQLLNGLENFLLDADGYHSRPPIRCDRLRL